MIVLNKPNATQYVDIRNQYDTSPCVQTQTQCNTIPCTQDYFLWYSIIALYRIVLYCFVLCRVGMYCVVLYELKRVGTGSGHRSSSSLGPAQYNTVRYNTIQYNIIRCNAMQCNAIPCTQDRMAWYSIIAAYPIVLYCF